MKNEKEYYNQDLQEILETHIREEIYGEFTPILNDIFQRRAYEFDFSIEHMIGEVQNFCKNVKSIKFASAKEFSSRHVGGTYFPVTSEIKLNQKLLNKFKRKDKSEFGKKLYEILAHEVFHGISDIETEEYSMMGLQIFDEQQCSGTALNEACTEAAADRISYSKDEKNLLNDRRETNGYSLITFIPKLLAASFGVTEKDFLKAGIQNRGKIAELLETLFPDMNNWNKANNIFRQTETNLDIIYNINYEKKYIDINREAKKTLHNNAIGEIYNNAYKLAGLRAYTNLDNPTKEYAENAIYNFLKIKNIIDDSLVKFNNSGKIVELSSKETEIIRSSEIFMNNINAINNLSELKNIISDDNTFKKQIELAKNGKFFIKENSDFLRENYNYENNYIYFLENSIQNLKYTSYIFQEDFDNGKKWNNTSNSIKLTRIFEAHKRNKNKTSNASEKDDEKTFSKIRNSLKNIFTKFKNRNLKQIIEPSQIVKNEDTNNYNNNSLNKTDYFSKYRVDPNSINHKIGENSNADSKDVIQQDKSDEGRI